MLPSCRVRCRPSREPRRLAAEGEDQALSGARCHMPRSSLSTSTGILEPVYLLKSTPLCLADLCRLKSIGLLTFHLLTQVGRGCPSQSKRKKKKRKKRGEKKRRKEKRKEKGVWGGSRDIIHLFNPETVILCNPAILLHNCFGKPPYVPTNIKLCLPLV